MKSFPAGGILLCLGLRLRDFDVHVCEILLALLSTWNFLHTSQCDGWPRCGALQRWTNGTVQACFSATVLPSASFWSGPLTWKRFMSASVRNYKISSAPDVMSGDNYTKLYLKQPSRDCILGTFWVYEEVSPQSCVVSRCSFLGRLIVAEFRDLLQMPRTHRS